MNRTIRITLTALATISLTASGSTIAFAGERGGNGEPVTINGHSACAYSGLEDQDVNHDGTFDGPVVPGEVQNWGILGKDGRAFFVSMSPLFQPGNACNPNGEPLPEP